MKRSISGGALRRLQDFLAAEAGTALRGVAEKRLESLLDELGAPNEPAVPGTGFSIREVTVLIADLRGFSAVFEALPHDLVLGALNRHLARMSEITISHRGTIDKFMGDSIMALFGAPDRHDDDVRRALACAVDMQIAMLALNEENRRLGMPDLFMGIGINTGTVMAGLLGSALHSEYTVVGNEVTVASRIEALALRGQILITEATFERCGGFVATDEPFDVYVKGKAEPVGLREVIALPSLAKNVPRQEVRRSPRVKVTMPFVYQIVEGKIVEPPVHTGTILDIGYQGILVQVDRGLAHGCEIKLTLNLSLGGHLATDVYARVLNARGGEGRVAQTATDVYARVLNVQAHEGRYLAGVEFTSVSAESSLGIRQFVQVLLQGAEAA